MSSSERNLLRQNGRMICLLYIQRHIDKQQSLDKDYGFGLRSRKLLIRMVLLGFLPQVKSDSPTTTGLCVIFILQIQQDFDLQSNTTNEGLVGMVSPMVGSHVVCGLNRLRVPA